MCCHLVHDKCLRQAGRSLNSLGERYGIGGFGQPRCGCPICNQEVSFWSAFKEAAAFPVFWMKKIQDCLEEIGPEGGPIPIEQVKSILKEKPDSKLTRAQKKYLRNNRGDDVGFYGALKEGNTQFVREEVNGGIANGGYIKMYCKENVWDWDEQRATLWMHKWGTSPSPTSNRGPNTENSAWDTKQGSSWWKWVALVALFVSALSKWFDGTRELAGTTEST